MIKNVSLPRRAANLARDARNVALAAASGQRVRRHAADRQRILEACENCPGGFYRNGWCIHQRCGCYVRAKSVFEVLKCPIGAWSQREVREVGTPDRKKADTTQNVNE